MSWILRIMLLWTLGYMSLFELEFSSFVHMCPGGHLLLNQESRLLCLLFTGLVAHPTIPVRLFTFDGCSHDSHIWRFGPWSLPPETKAAWRASKAVNSSGTRLRRKSRVQLCIHDRGRMQASYPQAANHGPNRVAWTFLIGIFPKYILKNSAPPCTLYIWYLNF